ncbi:MAG: D-aminoacylase [Alphaproteobacteria bacterium]|nr:MAG: D-aminoacylase [Alphaproteobacteria bacterium]
MYDYLIKGGTIVDGTGTAPIIGDVAIADGKIAAIGANIDGPAKETIDAAGLFVTPGWVDVHTHYDGQVAWDDVMDPSASNGVTTAIMGNCGVGFAPVPKGGEKALIELMEGVEDIPGTALYEGMPWGAWETFPEYLEFLDSRKYSIDIGAQIAHGPIRNYVMGERGRDNEDATAQDLEHMSQIIEEAINAGAVGVTSSRTIGHRSINGEAVPGTFAADEELDVFAEAIKRAGKGVFEIIPSSAIGDLSALGGEPKSTLEEVEMMARLSKESGRPITFTLIQVFDQPDLWREVLALVAEHNKNGAQLRPQVCSRPIGMITGLTGYHLFQRRESFLKIADLPLAERITEMKKPEVKAQILADEDIPHPQAGSMQNVSAAFKQALSIMFKLESPIDYEPVPEKSFEALAQAEDRDPEEYMYDFLLEDDGKSFGILLGANYLERNYEVIREMLTDDNTVVGLSDAGAHVSLIVDGAMPTYQLIHWVRDRTRGEKLPIEFIVNKQTLNNANLYGLTDRGSLEVGKRADVNIIDLENLETGRPVAHYDLPVGGRRIMQPIKGYKATFVNGVQTRKDDQDTGARPGRVARAA